jgi:hypothetical protein
LIWIRPAHGVSETGVRDAMAIEPRVALEVSPEAAIRQTPVSRQGQAKAVPHR